MNLLLIALQLLVNLLYGLLRKSAGRKFKVFAMLFFPFLAIVWPVLELAQMIIELGIGAPDATAVSIPVLVPVGLDSSWLLQILLAIGIQLVFNRWLINWLQNQRRARN